MRSSLYITLRVCESKLALYIRTYVYVRACVHRFLSRCEKSPLVCIRARVLEDTRQYFGTRKSTSISEQI